MQFQFSFLQIFAPITLCWKRPSLSRPNAVKKFPAQRIGRSCTSIILIYSSELFNLLLPNCPTLTSDYPAAYLLRFLSSTAPVKFPGFLMISSRVLLFCLCCHTPFCCAHLEATTVRFRYVYCWIICIISVRYSQVAYDLHRTKSFTNHVGFS